MSLISDAFKSTLSMAAAATGEPVTYFHKATGTTHDVTNAIRGATQHEAENVFPGTRVGDVSGDWVIEAAQVMHEAVELEPGRGDKITDEAGTIYQVMPSEVDGDFWKWVDRLSRTRRRVFTKERN